MLKILSAPFLLGCLLWLAAAPALAEDEGTSSDRPPINTNRPTQGTNTGVVGPGVAQLELGVNSIAFKGGGGSLTQVVGQLRLGLTDTVELDVTNPFYNNIGHNSGSGDVSVQLKLPFATTPVHHGTATFALVPSVTFQTGAPAFRNAGPIYTLLFSADVSVGSQGQNLTLNLAGTSLEDAATGERFGQVFTAAYYTFPISDGASMWLEVSGVGPDASTDGVFLPSVDTGMQFYLDNDSAIDFDLLKGLGPRGADWGVTVGFGHRF